MYALVTDGVKCQNFCEKVAKVQALTISSSLCVCGVRCTVQWGENQLFCIFSKFQNLMGELDDDRIKEIEIILFKVLNFVRSNL